MSKLALLLLAGLASDLRPGMQLDSSGRPRRRLRERLALALATATGGVFEVPDVTAPTGWRTEQMFELRAIR